MAITVNIYYSGINGTSIGVYQGIKLSFVRRESKYENREM